MKRLGMLLAAFAALARAEARAEEPPLPSQPPLTLTVTAEPGGAPWRVVVSNGGDLPMRIAADARLLSFDLTPRGSGAPTVRCALPASARPSSDEGTELVIPGKRSWTTTIDPLFLCFRAEERALLVPGTTVTASLGWPPALAPAPAPAGNRAASKRAPSKRAASSATARAARPAVAVPVGAAVGKLADASTITGAPFTLSDGVTVSPPPSSAAAASGTPADDTGETSKMAIRTTEAIDVARGVDVVVNVTVANEGDRPVTTFLRASTLAFTVQGPSGSVSCGTPRAVSEPFRELFTTIAARKTAQLTLLLTALCPAGTFDEPGVYRVISRLDTRGTSGRNVGLKTWDGEVRARTPMLLRVRAPRRPGPSARPRLDGAPT
jgi:hypothetical protein